jgi:hypothetical protein
MMKKSDVTGRLRPILYCTGWLALVVMLIMSGLTRSAFGSFGTNICPCATCVGLGEHDHYELIKHQPPATYSVVSHCGARDEMAWAETPVTEKGGWIGREGSGYLRVRLGYYRGTLVVVETQIPVRALADLGPRRGLGELEHVKGVQIDHMDVVYSPGHEGQSEPHYDVREYLVGHAEHRAFECQPAIKKQWFRFIGLFD